MPHTNPETENQLSALAYACVKTMEGEGPVVNEHTEALLRALLMSGYARNAKTSLQAELEARVRDVVPKRIMNRGREVSVIAGQLHEKFEHLTLWESNQPVKYTPSKAANISSATES